MSGGQRICVVVGCRVVVVGAVCVGVGWPWDLGAVERSSGRECSEVQRLRRFNGEGVCSVLGALPFIEEVGRLFLTLKSFKVVSGYVICMHLVACVIVRYMSHVLSVFE